MVGDLSARAALPGLVEEESDSRATQGGWTFVTAAASEHSTAQHSTALKKVEYRYSVCGSCTACESVTASRCGGARYLHSRRRLHLPYKLQRRTRKVLTRYSPNSLELLTGAVAALDASRTG